MPETRWERVESLFHEALRLAPEQREAFLEQVRDADPSLYNEISSLLSHYRSEDDLLEKMGVPPLNSAEPARPAFNSGDHLGPYEILSLAGRGGMGEVYAARDHKLGRKVALKILPKNLSGGAAMERLRREAQAASALNHPNILTIFDFGSHGETQYMVAELVEGTSLRQHIGKLSTAQALNYARQIGEALKSAHAAGIVHRDIKPENIMVRSDGYIKVLDFGLAKLAQPQAETGQSLFQRLAESDVASIPGLLVGTINYMSPEQVRGQTLDQRTDIWSWGVVLYEMLRGRRPFEAPTPGDTLAAILNRDPEPPSNNADLNRVVTKALARNLADRYQTINEALEDLSRVQAGRERRFAGVIRKLKRRSGLVKTSVFALTAAVVLAAAAAGYWKYQKPRMSDPVGFPIRVESVTPLTNSGNSVLAAISPDEQTIAYTTREGNGQQALWLRQNGANAGTRKLGSESGQYMGLTFSPDGQSLYYVLKQDGVGKLYQLHLPDSYPKMVRDDVDSPISFSPNGDRYAFLRHRDSKSQIVTEGVALSPEQIIWAASAPDYPGDPVWSPDGCCILFSILYNSSLEPTNIRLISKNVSSGEYRETQRQPWYFVGKPVWLNNGQSILISATKDDSNWARLWEVSWPEAKITLVLPYTFRDLDIGKDQREIATVEWVRHSTPWIVSLEGPSVPQHMPDLQGTYYGVAWTRSGHLISQSDIGGKPDLWSIDPATGRAQAITHDQGVKEYPAVSPDDRYLVYDSNHDGTFQLWRSNLDGSDAQRLTADTSIEKQAAITPDGKWIVYTSIRSGTYALWKVPMQGGRPVPLSQRAAFDTAISPDGAFILCRYDDPQHGQSTAILDSTTGKGVRLLPDVPANEKAPPVWSADGKSVLYVRTQNGVSNIWAKPLHGGSRRQLTQFSEEKIFAFALSPDGRSLACIRGDESWNAVLIRTAQ